MKEIYLWKHEKKKLNFILSHGVDFKVFDAKEISIKDLKTMRKYADGLRKKGFAISPRPKKKAE